MLKNVNLQFNKNSYEHIKNDLPRSDFFYLLGKCSQSVELFVWTTPIEDKYENTKLGWPIFAILKFSKFWRLIFAPIFQFLKKKNQWEIFPHIGKNISRQFCFLKRPRKLEKFINHKMP